MRSLLFIVALVCLQNGLHAQFRKYSNEFLNIGAGARGLAMGGAQVATVQDATAGYWNPAGLVGTKQAPNLALMHAEYFAGIGKYDYLAFVNPLKDENKSIGVSFLRFAVDDIPNTLFLVEPDGTINYNNIQTFSSADYALLLSYAQSIREDDEEHYLRWGANAKIIHRRVGKFAAAWGFGLDAGVQMRNGNWLFGISARDITTTFNAWTFNFTDRQKEVLYLTNNDIPVRSTEMTAPRLVVGAARYFAVGAKSSLMAEFNADLTFDGKRNTVLNAGPVSFDPRLGLEFGINNTLFLRGGIANFQQALADGDTLNQKKVWIYQPSLGAGFKIGNVQIDYGFSNLANQANPLYSHIFSLKIDLFKNPRQQKL